MTRFIASSWPSLVPIDLCKTLSFSPIFVFTLGPPVGQHPVMRASMMLMTATLAVLAIFAPSFPTARATNSTDLKILVPLKLGFQEFVSWIPSETPVTSNSVVNFSGFAINVFQECVEKLNYHLNYTLIGYGDGLVDPAYSDLVQKLVSKVLRKLYLLICV